MLQGMIPAKRPQTKPKSSKGKKKRRNRKTPSLADDCPWSGCDPSTYPRQPQPQINGQPDPTKPTTQAGKCGCTICLRARHPNLTPNPDPCQCTICQRASLTGSYEEDRADENENIHLERIPNEVWSNIWGYLPPSDLNKVMRTCSFLHNSVVPSLYRKIIIQDPSQLFYGLDHLPSKKRSETETSRTIRGRLLKLEMIKSIRHLHFAYDQIKVPRNNKWSLNSKHIDQWECLTDLSIKTSQIAISTQLILSALHHRILSSVGGLFKNLKTISFGYRTMVPMHDHNYYRNFLRDARDYKKFNGPYSELTVTRDRREITNRWTNLLMKHIKPLHICREVANGPFGFGFASSYEHHYASIPHTHTIHYGSRHLKSRIRPKIIYGTLNRWIMEDITLTELMYLHEDYASSLARDQMLFVQMILNWLKSITLSTILEDLSSRNGNSPGQATTIKIYSSIDWSVLFKFLKIHVPPYIINHGGPPEKSVALRMEYNEIGEGESKVTLTSQVYSKYDVVVDLAHIRDAGPCPACGAQGGYELCT
ncbi:hypothetical protein I302_105369 [Kwoniella bestiolae CBS 10118]|uniref:F-box domain-containing protein n=1 Tax=Kwoniella bestiolae CBS 10118 TaxID=1296100 RepID=A0AAJ8K9Q1_9TREE